MDALSNEHTLRNALKCRTLGTCIAECARTYQWRGKWMTVQFWKDSGSAMEKSHPFIVY